MSCCPLPKDSASAASLVPAKASFWAGKEANSRFVFKPVKLPSTKSTSALIIQVTATVLRGGIPKH